MPRDEDSGVKKYLQVPRTWSMEWTPSRHVGHAVNCASMGTLPLGAHGVIDLSRLHEAACARHWPSYRILSGFLQSSDICRRTTLEYQKRHRIVDGDTTCDTLHARGNDKCLTLTNFLQKLRLPKSPAEVIVAEKPTFTELGARPDSVMYVKESPKQAARRLGANVQSISTEDRANLCYEFNTGRCLHGADVNGYCAKANQAGRLAAHRCWCCLARHPGIVCGMARRHPLDTRCPCAEPCPPFMCIRGDLYVFRDLPSIHAEDGFGGDLHTPRGDDHSHGAASSSARASP